jgi:hypothetical protein
LPSIWNNNRESMLSLVETVHWGVEGVVTGALNGLPLDAKVTVIDPAPVPIPDSHHPATHPVFTDPDVGDYHRMLLPTAVYTIEFSAPGYVTQTIPGVLVTMGQTNQLDVQLMPVDTTPPFVSSQFMFNASKPALDMQFTEDVSASLSPGDLSLVNLTTGQPMPGGAISMQYNSFANVATFTFPGLPNGVLPDGNYRATLAAGSFADEWGNAYPVAYDYNFFALAGDADHDRDVDVNDLGILATHWQKSPRAFSQGDFDYNGTVDVNDLGILASHWQQGLAPPLAPASISGRSPRRATERFVDQIFAA